MTERANIKGLQVDKTLYDFFDADALPGLGMDSDAFWGALAQWVIDLGPRNNELLDVLEALQANIDA